MASPLQVKNLKVHQQAGTENTLYAKWTYDGDHLDSYEVKWYYATGDTYKKAKRDKKGKVLRYKSGKNKGKIQYKTLDYWFEGSLTTVKIKQATYTIPSNATKVYVNVKPIAKKDSKNKPYFTGKYTDNVVFKVKDLVNPPASPSTPTVTITGTSLKAYIENYTLTTGSDTVIDFEVIENDSNRVARKANAAIKRGYASYTCAVSAGKRYKVRARAVAPKPYGTSDWTDYSGNEYTAPAAITDKPTASIYTEDSIKIAWKSTSGATGYEIEYTDDYKKFDISSDVQSDRLESKNTTRILSGLTVGTKWYFRVRAFNDAGDAPWPYSTKTTKTNGTTKTTKTPIYGSIIVGTAPSAPTTWTYSSIITPTDKFRLNWTHNSQDGSEQKNREVVTSVTRGSSSESETFSATNANQFLELDATEEPTALAPLQDGDVITWKVRTKGIFNAWSDYSTERSIRVYAKPTLSVSLDQGEEVTGYPIKMTFTAGPPTQKIVSMYVAIVADDDYTTTQEDGEDRVVLGGDEVFSRTIENPESNTVTLELTPGDVHLENAKTYTIQATAGMDSGLVAESTDYEFRVTLSEDPYAPYADIYVDDETLAASITPYCVDENYIPVREGGTMSVYRREYDGTFTPIGLNLDMASATTVVDPHPALDYARYRITARSATTGRIYYTDMPGVAVEETAVVIQWDEAWSFFDARDNTDDDITWVGSMLRLPYNIDVSDTFDQDSALVEYIGREYPVSYYGTQKGHTSSWKVEIPKTDADTLYSIRRLARYAGDCYVREPSGTGYWAQIDVSYSITHAKPTIPVTFSITHVDGPTPVEQEVLYETEPDEESEEEPEEETEETEVTDA